MASPLIPSSSSSRMQADSPPAIVNVHTPTSSFSLIHSFTQDTIQTLFRKLNKKFANDPNHDLVGPGWIKYEWNNNVWNLDDESDYTIFSWRTMSPSSEGDNTPTLFVHNPKQPLPAQPTDMNPLYYIYRRALSPPIGSPSLRSRSRRNSHSTKSGKSKFSGMSDHADGLPTYRKDFIKFHSENGVRTVTGSIGPVQNVRMLLKSGYRHVYISRSFAKKHGFIPKDAAPGMYGYGGLVNIGQWPITLGKTKTTHIVYLAEETHFDCILGRAFMEKRGVKTDPTDPTNITCMDTGEQIDCEVVIIRDGNGEIVTVT